MNRSPSSRQLKKYKFFLPVEIYLLAVFMQLASKFRVFPLVLKFRDSFASVYCCSNLYFVVLRVLVRFTSSLFRRVFLRNQFPFVAAVFELLVVGFQLSTSQYLIIEKSLCSFLVDHIILRFLYLYIF